MKYEEIRADVTQFPVICHCISVDCAMGAGVVVPIKKKFPMLKINCELYAVSNKKTTLGSAFRYEQNQEVCYNMFTKTRVRQNYSTMGDAYYGNLENALEHVRDQMMEHKETHLWMPKIGSGLDRGNWETIKKIILRVFQDTDITITVCLWD